MKSARKRQWLMGVIFAIATIGSQSLFVKSALAQVTAFKQAIAEAASDDRDLAAFYRETGYQGVWTGTTPEDITRRRALFAAISGASARVRFPVAA